MTLSDFFISQPHGARRRFAAQVGIAPAYLYQIEKGLKPAPVRRVIDIAKASGWAVTPHDLYPEMYPNPTDGLPFEAKEAITYE